MSLRWQFLSEEERQKLEDLDLKMVSLVGQRTKNPKSEEFLEAEIKKLHTSINLFIFQLEEKYCRSRASVPV